MLYIILPLLFSIVMLVVIIKDPHTQLMEIITMTLLWVTLSTIAVAIMLLFTTVILEHTAENENKLIESTEYEMVTYHPEYGHFIATNKAGIKETIEIEDKKILMYEVDEGFKVDKYDRQFTNKHLEYLLPLPSEAEYHIYLKGED